MWLQNDFYVLEATLSLALTAILCIALPVLDLGLVLLVMEMVVWLGHRDCQSLGNPSRDLEVRKETLFRRGVWTTEREREREGDLGAISI